MARVRAVVTLPYTSGIPSDVSMNTFHFATANSPASIAEVTEIFANLIAFYNSDFGTPGDPLSEYYGHLVSRVANACTIELFDLADLPPRQPFNSTSFTLGAPAVSNTLPLEVALCGSFQADPISGVPQARRRGRVYIGPFNGTVLDVAGLAVGRPADALSIALQDAMEGIFNLQAGSGVTWSVYSRIDDALYTVTNGWVDNEWDTQRRRGRDASFRFVWP